MTDKVAEISARWSVETRRGLPRIEDQSFQSSWTKMRYAQTLESLLDNANVITQARLLTASCTESAAWLAALPVSTFGNLFDGTSFRISVGVRLGASICSEHAYAEVWWISGGIMDWPAKRAEEGRVATAH